MINYHSATPNNAVGIFYVEAETLKGAFEYATLHSVQISAPPHPCYLWFHFSQFQLPLVKNIKWKLP